MSLENIPIRIISLVVVTLLLSGYTTTANQEKDPRSIVFPFLYIGNIDKAHLNKPYYNPSGICFHSKRGTLFVVFDLGALCEMKTDGTVINEKLIMRADFEGITHDPSTGLLYVAIERTEQIIELEPDTFTVLRKFSIPRKFMGNTLLKAGGQGIEAITFVPDINHPHGGTFYITNQSYDLEDAEDISAVFEVEVPLKSNGDTNIDVKILRYFPLGIIDLSGLHFDKATGHLYVISDSTNTIFEISRTGKILSGYAFPGDNQEGITVDDQSFLYIAQDSGGILKIKWTN
ncbi:MAG: SdiA-regulated domain-containing protein [Candidatus Hodarchaeota archaeon]